MILNVAIVDDEPGVRKLIQADLRKYFPHVHVVGEAGSFADGKELLMSGRFDVVFMDCEMPNMDGYTATQRIRVWEKNKHIAPVLIYGVSAHALTEYQQQGMAAGMNDFLVKPLKQQDLSKALTQVMTQLMINKLAR